MKKLLIVSSILVAFAISCEDVTVQNNNVQTVEITTITAESNSNSEQTKTLLDEGMKTNWIAGDAINVFFGASESGVFTTEDSGDIAQFKGYISVVTGGGEGLTDETSLWGVYPYSKDTKCDGTNITYTLPSIQASKADSFADDLFPQIAKSKNFYMSFYNLCGLIRFKVASDDIVKVTIKGKNEESLAGTALVGMDDVPFVKEITDGKSELEMSAPDGECFNTDAYYYFVLYPTNFTEGLTITYYKENSSASYDISTYNLARNKCASITDKDAELSFSDLDNNTGDEDDSEEILIERITLDTDELKEEVLDYHFILYPTQTRKINITSYRPITATNVEFTWSSDLPTVATVDQSGLVTAVSAGYATITVASGNAQASCVVRVNAYPESAIAKVEYIDEYGYNHGFGVVIGGQCWAPVNCGYHSENYPYGKLYQWGRIYGQGLGGEYDNGEITFRNGGVSLITGQSPSNANVFYYWSEDWLSPSDGTLWDAGSECNPCPDGWRVPTYTELSDLSENYSNIVTLETGQIGRYFSGVYEYSESAAKIFLPAATRRDCIHGELGIPGYYGAYWSSRSSALFYNKSEVEMRGGWYKRGDGLSVRCVQE